jgi:hypothetical protein
MRCQVGSGFESRPVSPAFRAADPEAVGGEGERVDRKASSLLHLAAVNRGVYYGSGGEFGLCTALTDEDLAHAHTALSGALADVGQAVARRV